MSETACDNMVVKINTALSNKPFFVKITDGGFSIDRIFAEAISTLKNTGKPLESQQLEQLFKQHQIFANGKVVQKGDIFRELQTKIQQVGSQSIQLLELDMISAHSGGMGMHNYPNSGFFIKVSDNTEKIYNHLTEESKEQFMDYVRENCDNFEETRQDIMQLMELFYKYLEYLFLEGDKEIDINFGDKVINAEIFEFEPDDEGEDVEDDELFLCFSENELYERIPTDLHKALENEGMKIEQKWWVSFG